MIPAHSATAQGARRVLWIGCDRLLSAGWDGEIREWNLKSNQVRQSSSSFGGPIWDIAYCASDELIAVACEDGSAKLFSSIDLSLVHSFVTQSSRVLSVAFGKGMLACGDAEGSVAVYNIESKRQVSKFRIATPKIESPVWSVAFAGDCLVTGDSLGYVQFWDFKFGILRNSYSTHQGPILTICVHFDSIEGDSVFASGADSRIVRCRPLPSGVFVVDRSSQAQLHDVTCLTICGRTLIAASLDGSIGLFGLHSFALKAPKLLLPYPIESGVSTSENRIVSVLFPHSVRLYRLGRVVPSKNDSSSKLGAKLELLKSYQPLVEIKPDFKLSISWALISKSSELLLLGNRDGVRGYSVELSSNNQVAIARIELPESISKLQVIRAAISDSILVFALYDGSVAVFSVADFSLKCQIPSLGALNLHLRIKSDSHILISDTLNNVRIVSPIGLELFRVPQCALRITAVEFHPTQSYILIASLSSQIYFVDFESGQQKAVGGDETLREPILGFAPLNNRVLAWTSRGLLSVSMPEGNQVEKINRYSDILHLSRISDSELLIIERPWKDVLTALPMPLLKHRYIS